MAKTKKEIEEWIKAFNLRQVERMKEDDYDDYIDEDDINGFERFRGGGEWGIELTVPQAILDLLPEWESSCWWEVDIVDEDGTDNWKSLYQDKKTFFRTIKSCYSFNEEDMKEMWFMNNATNYLLQNFYPLLETYCKPQVFAKACYNVIKKLDAELIEMKSCKSKSLCCGAGGAQMFKEPEKGNQDINIKRSEEAIKTNAKIVAVSCPFCSTMMSDGMTSKQKDIDVVDIAQMIEKAEDL